MPEADIRVGSEFAGYLIESLIGRGGMSVVYLAKHLRLGRNVAFKVLAPELAQEEGFRDRFIRESRLAASIDHPNIVPIYDAGEIEGVLYIAMRYVQGTDMKRRLRETGALPMDQVVSLIGQVASALDAAHERGLVHRDVKPGNVLLASGVGVERSDHAYLADFGLTKQALSVSGMTATGQLVGTIDYVAPEQIRGELLDGRADVYSLACLLFECLDGHPPFKRDSEVATLYAQLQEQPPSITDRRSDLAVGVDDVVSKAMAKSPADRFDTAGELAAAVRKVLAKDTERQAPAGRTPRRRPRLVGLFAAGAAALLVALVAVFLTRGSGREAPSAGSSGKPRAAAAPPLNSVVQIDPTGKARQTVRSMPVPCGEPPTLAVGEAGVWYRSCTNVEHVDAETGQTKSVIPVFYGQLGTSPELVIANRTVWIPSAVGAATPAIVRLDPATDEQLRSIRFPKQGPVAAIAVEGDTLWAGFGNGTILRIDSRTGRVTRQLRIPGAINFLAVGADSIWALDQFNGIVSRIAESTGMLIAQIHVTGGATEIAAGQEGVWIMDPALGAVIPINVDSNAAASPIRVGSRPTDVAEGFGSVWVTDADGVLREIDPATHVQKEIRIGTSLAFVAPDRKTGTIWLAVAPLNNR